MPILSLKRGEQNAIRNLDKKIKDSITPLFEIPFNRSTSESINTVIEGVWKGRAFYFYLDSDWFSEAEDHADMQSIIKVEYKKLPVMHAIPVFNLSNSEGIDDWLTSEPSSKLGIRIRNEEFELIDNNLNNLFKVDPNRRSRIDLILDLGIINSELLFAKKSVLKAVFTELDHYNEYHSIIIASGSFPAAKEFQSFEAEKVFSFPRYEVEIHTLALKLKERFGFNYIYADYGPTNLEENTFVIGMVPNFKIRYSTFDEYLYIKGRSIKKGGLDRDQVAKLCEILTRHPDFSGEKFSWGDDKIVELSCCYKDYTQGNPILSSTGNLTSWVSYTFNHHITLIVNQVG